MKIVVDCGNGTGSIIIKDVLDSLNVEYKLINCESDGNFPVHDPDHFWKHRSALPSSFCAVLRLPRP